MESISNLLDLPTAADVQNDKFYNYDPNSSYLDKREFEWSFHYEWIGRLELQLQDIDITLARLAKGANQHIRIRRALAERQRTAKRHQLLMSGWGKISVVLREESIKLYALPREIRDRIYEYLYTVNRPIRLAFPDTDVNGRMLPRDPYMYMNATIIDPGIAVEAAKICYQENLFEFMASFSSHASRFLTTDHYSSGIVPRDVIRRLHVGIGGSHRYFYEGEVHEDFEKMLREQQRFHPDLYSHRSLFEPIMSISDLRVLEFTISDWGWSERSPPALRTIAPLFRILREKGVKMMVRLKHEHGYYDWREEEVGKDFRKTKCRPGDICDISNYFLQPTEKEQGLLGRERGLYPKEFGGEKCGYISATHRVYFDEHFQVYLRLEASQSA